MATTGAIGSTGTITFAGVGSGIDTESIVTGLVSASSDQLNALKSKASDTHTAVTTLSNISSLLSTLQTATSALTDVRDAASYTAAVVGDGVVATASGTASPGAFSVQVTSLAKEQRSYSDTFGSGTDALGQEGTLQIGVGSTATPASIDIKTTDSLQNIADKINSAGIRATASVFYDGSTYRLQVRGMDTGAANSVNMTETGTALGLTKPLNTFQKAGDASLLIDGYTVTRPTNQVTGAIPGVTLALTKETTTPATVSISADPNTLAQKLTAVVKAYNAVVSQIHTVAGYGTVAGTSPVLKGDSTLRSVTSKMSSAMLSTVSGAGQFQTLASIGFSLNQDGTIALDQTKLTNATATDSGAVATLLAGAGPTGKGAMDVMSDVISSLTDAGTGILALKQQAIGDRATSLDDSATRENDRLTQYAADLRKQFTSMDSTVSANNTMLNYLTKLYG